MQNVSKFIGAAVALALGVGSAHAQSPKVECAAPEALCKQLTDYVVANIKPWLSEAAIVNSINTQNAASAKMTNVDIDKADVAWTKRSDKNLIDSKMNNELSTFLRTKKDGGNGVIFEIFVFDNKGLNVGETDLTQDYNQGDEAKYWKTFGVGPDAIFVDKVGKDGGRNISQASLAIKDPETGAAIGAVTVGIDVDKLK